MLRTAPIFIAVGVALALLGAASADGPPARAPAAGGPIFTADGRLVPPANYREWVFLTSGVGMTYGPVQPEHDHPPFFDNVFVTPAAYERFVATGTWPEHTMLILEIRHGEVGVSINNGGQTQGAIAGVEAAVKDSKRFPRDGWGYFSFDDDGEPVEAHPLSAGCYGCHRRNTAVDNTFVQFYPTLLPIAKRLGTIRKDYDPTRKVE